SRVTARPSPIRSTAVYRDRFMVAKIRARATTGPHCRRVNARNLGRTELSSTAPATHWRTATTPAGPSAGKASAAVAAPSWLDAALPVISAMPANLVLMAGAWTAPSYAQNAWIESAIRSGYGSGTEAPALPGRDRRLGDLHRRRDRTRHLAGRGVSQPDGARAG